jgi:uncharacterized membrane protein
MYTIIGGDGKEYGPVTAEQVRSWVSGGRANLDTRVKAAGSEEWKRIGDCQEFYGPGPSAGAPPLATAALAGRTPQLQVISCYERSWALLKANFWPLVGVNFLMTVIVAAIGATQYMGLFFMSPLLGGVLSGGWYYYFLLKIRGQPTTIGDAFAGFTRACVVLIVISILKFIFVAAGLVCLALPGIYLSVAYAFAFLLATDKRLGFWESMETSRKIITAQWWRVLGLILLGIPFFLLGLIALGVGIFVAVPLMIGALAYAYEDLCNPKG